jgi:hypothetical protein
MITDRLRLATASDAPAIAAIDASSAAGAVTSFELVVQPRRGWRRGTHNLHGRVATRDPGTQADAPTRHRNSCDHRGGLRGASVRKDVIVACIWA